MTPFSSKNISSENKLIGNILRKYPPMAGIMERHFGGHSLERSGFKIQTLGMTCILFGINQEQLLQEFDKTQH